MKIFVSYSRRDSDVAKQIHEYFEDPEYDVFTDVNDIQIGDIWSNRLEENISNCDIFVIIITHASLRSFEVQKEVLQAQRENKTIIPCIDENVGLDEIKWGLEKIQGIRFENSYKLSRDLYSRIKKTKRRGQFKKQDTYTQPETKRKAFKKNQNILKQIFLIRKLNLA